MKILKVPLVKQPKGTHFCQIACAQMVLEYYGDEISTKEFVRELGDSVLEKGTESEAVARVLAARGYGVLLVSRTPLILNQLDRILSNKNVSELNRIDGEVVNEDAKRKVYLIRKLLSAGGYYFPGSWDLSHIDEKLEKGIPVIVHVKASLFYEDESRQGGHAVVVVGKKDNEYLINDPSPRTGEAYWVPENKLLESWQSRSGRTLVVEKNS